MWIYFPDAFVSIVVNRDRPNDFLVRARFKGDIERVFGARKVDVTPDFDYRYRASIGRNVVIAKVAKRMGAIDYDNVKGSVGLGSREDARHAAMMRAWTAARDAQEHVGNVAGV